MKAFAVCLRWTLLGLLLAVIVAFTAVLDQLFPSAPALAGLGLLRTLAKPLASLALELALLGGVPAGFAFGVVRVRPALRELAFLLVIPALLSVIVLALSRQVDLKDDSPGNVVEGLIAAARQSCEAGGEDVPVPIVNVTLRCSDGKLSGAAPVGKGTFKASELVPSADLSRLEISGFELSLPAGKSLPGLHVKAAEARVRGLRPWGRPRAEQVPRSWSLWLAVLMSSAAAALLGRHQNGRRALFIGLGAGLAAAFAARALDRSPSAWGLLLLPLAGVTAAILSQLGWDLWRTLMAHFQTRHLRRQRAIARAAGRW